MRLIHVYLIAYFALVIGAGFALWRAGVAYHLPPLWIALGAVVALGLGLILAALSVTPGTDPTPD